MSAMPAIPSTLGLPPSWHTPNPRTQGCCCQPRFGRPKPRVTVEAQAAEGEARFPKGAPLCAFPASGQEPPRTARSLQGPGPTWRHSPKLPLTHQRGNLPKSPTPKLVYYSLRSLVLLSQTSVRMGAGEVPGQCGLINSPDPQAVEDHAPPRAAGPPRGHLREEEPSHRWTTAGTDTDQGGLSHPQSPKRPSPSLSCFRDQMPQKQGDEKQKPVGTGQDPPPLKHGP